VRHAATWVRRPSLSSEWAVGVSDVVSERLPATYPMSVFMLNLTPAVFQSAAAVPWLDDGCEEDADVRGPRIVDLANVDIHRILCALWGSSRRCPTGNQKTH
jgi:hypothetical protein